MPKYEVIATNYGLNLNYEFITDTALASFPAAFPDGQPSHFMHASEKVPYPPLIGVTVGTPVVDATKATAVIDFTDDFARNFEDTNNTFDVSIYSKATWHWDDDWTQVIDELLYDPENAIDVVMYGAAKEAKVTKKVEDRVKDGVNADETQGFVRFSSTMALKLMEEPKKEGKAMEKQAIKDALAEVITELKLADDDVSRIADAVAAIPPSVVEPPTATELEVDIQQVIADSLKAGAESGLTGKSIERVSNAVLKGDSIEDAITNEKALIDEFKEQFKTEVIEDSVHKYGGNPTPTSSVQSLLGRAYKKGGK